MSEKQNGCVEMRHGMGATYQNHKGVLIHHLPRRALGQDCHGQGIALQLAGWHTPFQYLSGHRMAARWDEK